MPVFKTSLLRRRNALENLLVTAAILLVTTCIAFLYWFATEHSANTALFYVTALVAVARYTTGYLPGILASLVGVVCVNYFFTYPAFTLDFTLAGYPVTFLAMLLISVAVTTVTSHMKEQAQALSRHEKLLAEAEKEKMKANLLRAISHDLRTPLTGISGAAAVLLEGEGLSERDRSLATDIKNDADALITMVENLLSVTRLQAGDTAIRKEPELLEEVAGDAVMRFRRRFPEARVELILPEEPVSAPMDALLIRQVISNLLENAARHSGAPETIRLTIFRQGELAVTEVTDGGRGLTEEVLAAVAQGRDLAASAGGDSSRGMGIGLAVCRNIVLAHGGTMEAENRPAGGAVFRFALPAEEMEASE